MNDCFWFSVMACDSKCKECGQYLSMNSKEGQDVMEEYQKDVEIAFKSITKWKAIFERIEELCRLKKLGDGK